MTAYQHVHFTTRNAAEICHMIVLQIKIESEIDDMSKAFIFVLYMCVILSFFYH